MTIRPFATQSPSDIVLDMIRTIDTINWIREEPRRRSANYDPQARLDALSAELNLRFNELEKSQ